MEAGRPAEATGGPAAAVDTGACLNTSHWGRMLLTSGGADAGACPNTLPGARFDLGCRILKTSLCIGTCTIPERLNQPIKPSQAGCRVTGGRAETQVVVAHHMVGQLKR